MDRGAWGLELLFMLACWKLALPQKVVLLRGNHESATCTLLYGFKSELMAKIPKADFKVLTNLPPSENPSEACFQSLSGHGLGSQLAFCFTSSILDDVCC